MKQTHANEGIGQVSWGKLSRIARPALVWTAVTVAVGAAADSAPAAWRTVGDLGDADLADQLVALCTAALLPALIWLWLITTVTVVGLVRGRGMTGDVAGVGATRRLVLLACGAAVIVGSQGPAFAAAGERPGDRHPDRAQVLVGLPLPDRPVAPRIEHRSGSAATPSPKATAPGTAAPATAPTTARAGSAGGSGAARAHVVVRPGDSLWSIALAHPDPSATTDERWRAIWSANRDVIGDDPDLILPGQTLRLPG